MDIQTGERKTNNSDENERGFEEFYKDMIKMQKQLGPEFEKILFDNLWELYDQ